MFDFEALNAKLLASALVLLIQLKIVVFPMLVIPIIPHFKPMNSNFVQRYAFIKFKIQNPESKAKSKKCCQRKIFIGKNTVFSIQYSV
jgi:hypothetical protein